jgi:succinoglycan biosynthesis protein ExoW
MTALEIVVVIPFYQHRPGVLARALASIAAQERPPDWRLRVIVVSDESPSDPALDLAQADVSQLDLKLIRQSNAGPASARNRGLAEIGSADFVALLDSDDVWTPEHLRAALEALHSCEADLYFSNNLHAGQSHWFAEHPRFLAVLAAAERKAGEQLTLIPPERLAEALLDDAVMHPSCLVFRPERLGAVRFDERLVSGEDHLYSVVLALKGRRPVVNRAATMIRGDDGLNYYRGALDWDSPRASWRAVTNLAKYRRASKTLADHPRLKNLAQSKAAVVEREYVYLLARNFRRHPAESWRSLRLGWRTLGLRLGLALLSLPSSLLRKARGELQFDV